MIIADLYVEKIHRANPRTIIIWRVYARSDEEIAAILSNYFPDRNTVWDIIIKANKEGRAAVRHKKVVDENCQFENWIVITPRIEEVAKMYLDVDGIHDFRPQYGFDDSFNAGDLA